MLQKARMAEALVRINNLAGNAAQIMDEVPTEVALRRKGALRRIEQLAEEGLREVHFDYTWAYIILGISAFWAIVLMVWARSHWWPFG